MCNGTYKKRPCPLLGRRLPKKFPSMHELIATAMIAPFVGIGEGSSTDTAALCMVDNFVWCL